MRVRPLICNFMFPAFLRLIAGNTCASAADTMRVEEATAANTAAGLGPANKLNSASLFSKRKATSSPQYELIL